MKAPADNVIELSRWQIREILKQEFERRGFIVRDVDVYYMYSFSINDYDVYADIEIETEEETE